MLLEALKPHPYGGEERKPGDRYPAPRNHAVMLIASRKAKKISDDDNDPNFLNMVPIIEEFESKRQKEEEIAKQEASFYPSYLEEPLEVGYDPGAGDGSEEVTNGESETNSEDSDTSDELDNGSEDDQTTDKKKTRKSTRRRPVRKAKED